MTTPHKHKDVIVAWANGEKVQYRFRPQDAWEDVHVPDFRGCGDYWVKPPEPKPDVIKKVYMELIPHVSAGSAKIVPSETRPNVVLTFNGDSGDLKGAVLIYTPAVYEDVTEHFNLYLSRLGTLCLGGLLSGPNNLAITFDSRTKLPKKVTLI